MYAHELKIGSESDDYYNYKLFSSKPLLYAYIELLRNRKNKPIVYPNNDDIFYYRKNIDGDNMPEDLDLYTFYTKKILESYITETLNESYDYNQLQTPLDLPCSVPLAGRVLKFQYQLILIPLYQT
jgi:hypothetical protein